MSKYYFKVINGDYGTDWGRAQKLYYECWWLGWQVDYMTNPRFLLSPYDQVCNPHPGDSREPLQRNDHQLHWWRWGPFSLFWLFAVDCPEEEKKKKFSKKKNKGNAKMMSRWCPGQKKKKKKTNCIKIEEVTFFTFFFHLFRYYIFVN